MNNSRKRKRSPSPSVTLPRIGRRGMGSFPSIHQLCKCDDCKNHNELIPGTTDRTNGRYLPDSEHKSHAKRQRKHDIAAQHLKNGTSGVSATNDACKQPGTPTRKLSSEDAHTQRKLDGYSNSMKCAKQVVTNNCVIFKYPPKHDTIFSMESSEATQVQYDIDEGVPENLPLLDYQRFLCEAKAFAENHRHSGQNRIKKRCDKLLDTCQVESDKLKTELITIWEAQKAVLNSGTAYDTGAPSINNFCHDNYSYFHQSYSARLCRGNAAA